MAQLETSPQIALEAQTLAAIYPHRSEKHRDGTIVPQMHHRIELLKHWEVKQGDKVLEIGCGQGDCTVALAAAIGASGHVTALDPASLDYGSPFTLGQAQAHLRSSALGSRMTFVQADPLAFLEVSTERYSIAVISHCIWYFSSPAYLEQLLAALKTRVGRVCIAEFALTATDPCSLPHLLTALTEASLECRKPISKSNIRTVLSPSAIDRMAVAAGLHREKQITFVPHEGMRDGEWETWAVLDDAYAVEIEEYVKDPREKAVVYAMRDAVRAIVDPSQPRSAVKTMDVWAASYRIAI